MALVSSLHGWVAMVDDFVLLVGLLVAEDVVYLVVFVGGFLGGFCGDLGSWEGMALAEPKTVFSSVTHQFHQQNHQINHQKTTK